MPRYRVELVETRRLTFEVEAADADAAAQVAHEADDPLRDVYDDRQHCYTTELEDGETA